jgi:Zn-dependent membrane protease YugP
MLAFFFFDPFWWVTIPGILVAMWAQMRLTSSYNRYSRVAVERGITGSQAARWLLDRNGMANVEVFRVSGHLSDHYDPGKRAVFLSSENFDHPSIAAVGIAAHEVGHAIQHKTGYAWLGLRMAMVGVTSFASRAAWFVIMGGMVLSYASRGPLGKQLLFIGMILFAVTVFFQVITLPVEFDASRRAKSELLRLGIITPKEKKGVESVLGAAALTYVAALVTSMLELLRIFLHLRHASDDDR